jgi:hypothetical protein
VARCIIHWYRDVFSREASTKVREVAAMLKAIHADEDLESGPAAGRPSDRKAARPSAYYGGRACGNGVPMRRKGIIGAFTTAAVQMTLRMDNTCALPTSPQPRQQQRPCAA